MTLLGIALAILGIVRLVVAANWVPVWPSNKSVAPDSLSHFLDWPPQTADADHRTHLRTCVNDRSHK